MNASHSQGAHRIRFDWGLDGAAAITPAEIAVVIDVLSFTTTLSVALDAGSTVLPYRWNDETAQRYADRNDAVLAVRRSQASPGKISLSPTTIRTASAPPRLVLPSPNGSTIAHRLSQQNATCVGASLRNATAVAQWIGTRETVAVIAAGERWPNGGLRPAAEDLWGAGAVIAALVTVGMSGLSPEAELARAGYLAVQGRELEALRLCASGRELIDSGYPADVDIAAEIDRSHAVPVLTDDRFIDRGKAVVDSGPSEPTR
jgi:2-phosphosulfolactate phosphatase